VAAFVSIGAGKTLTPAKKGTPTRAKDGIRKRNPFFFTAMIIFTIRGHEKRFFVSFIPLVPRGQKTRHFIGLSF
jgi:hypothetical protein